MAELKTFALKCPNCGGALKVNEAVDTFACGYCGASVRVERSGGVITLEPLTEAMHGIKRSTDHTASELAIRRLMDELKACSEQERALKQSLDTIQLTCKDKCKAITDQSSFIPVAIVVGIAAVLTWTLFGNYPQVALFASGIAALVTGGYVIKTIDRGHKRAIAKLIGTRDSEIAAIETQLATLHSDIASKSASLQKHRAIVDS